MGKVRKRLGKVNIEIDEATHDRLVACRDSVRGKGRNTNSAMIDVALASWLTLNDMTYEELTNRQLAALLRGKGEG
jgi:hypothetical protein